MKISKLIGDSYMREVSKARVGEFNALARLHAKGGDLTEAVKLRNYTPNVQSFVANHVAIREFFDSYRTKAAVSALSTSNSGVLGDYEQMSSAYLESTGIYSVFRQMFPFMKNVQLMQNISVVTAAAVGSAIGEGQLKKISRLSFTSERVDLIKVVAAIVVSDEIIDFSGPRGAAVFNDALARAGASAVDTEFLRGASVGVTPIASTGVAMSNLRADMRGALRAVPTSDASALFWIMSADLAKRIAVLGDDILLRDFGANGGTLAGLPVGISDAAGTNLYLIDANAFAADAGLALPSQSTQALLQMSDDGDSPVTANTVSLSLWQTGSRAMMLEIIFGVNRLRDSAVAIISGCYYGSTDSPPT